MRVSPRVWVPTVGLLVALLLVVVTVSALAVFGRVEPERVIVRCGDIAPAEAAEMHQRVCYMMGLDSAAVPLSPNSQFEFTVLRGDAFVYLMWEIENGASVEAALDGYRVETDVAHRQMLEIDGRWSQLWTDAIDRMGPEESGGWRLVSRYHARASFLEFQTPTGLVLLGRYSAPSGEVMRLMRDFGPSE